LPCRSEEKVEIEKFLMAAMNNQGSSTSLYISGMPGTGKTATTLEVVK
jgi:Cdc6-like AAA superfamily ATPase